jgi:hypothetical protein
MKCAENANAQENLHTQELKKLLKLLGSIEPTQSAYTRTETEILIDTVRNSALLIALALLSTRSGKEARDV